MALALGLLSTTCSRPPEHLSEELVAELIDRHLDRPAQVAAIVTKRTGTSVRAGEGKQVAAERQLGLLGIDRNAWNGSVCSALFAGTVTAGWGWVSRDDSGMPEHNSARPIAIWVAEAVARASERPVDASGLVSALRATQIPDGQRWAARFLGAPGGKILLLETVPAGSVPAGGPVPWVLLAFRGETPSGSAELERLGGAVVREAAQRPESLVYAPGAEAFLHPPKPFVDPNAIPPALPPPESFEARVDKVAVTFEAFDDIPELISSDGDRGTINPRRKRLIRVFLSSSGEVVGASAEVVAETPGEYFLGGWYLSGNANLLREWRRFLENHHRKGKGPAMVEPLRCPWPAFLPWPRWFEEPAELEVQAGKTKGYSGPVWGAGGATSGRGYRFSWFSIDDEGVVRYAIHQAAHVRRKARWGGEIHTGFEGKRYAGLPPPMKSVMPVQGQPNVPFYDGLIVEDAVGTLTIKPNGNGFELGPLFLDFEFEPVPLRVISPRRPDSARPWGEIPR